MSYRLLELELQKNIIIMKKLQFVLLAVFTVGLLLSSSVTDNQNESYAEVDKVDGIYIFHFCEPIKEYDYLGTISLKVVWSNSPDKLISVMTKKCKNMYPNGEGIIISDDMGSFQIIRFK